MRDFLGVQNTRVELQTTDDVANDPAEKDMELKKKIDENKAIGEQNLNKASETKSWTCSMCVHVATLK